VTGSARQATSRSEATAPLPAHRLPPGVVAAVVAAWALLAAAQLTHARVLDHDALFESRQNEWVGVVGFVVAWQAMVAAMMLPGSFSVIRARAADDAGLGRFLVGFAAVWTAFALAALNVDSVVHRVVDQTSWLAARPHLVLGGLFLVVGVLEMAPVTQRSLGACRDWGDGHHAGPHTGAFRDGLRYGQWCVSCDGALMFLMFGAGKGSLAWMIGLTVMMTVPRHPAVRAEVPRVIGAALVAVGVGLVVAGLSP